MHHLFHDVLSLLRHREAVRRMREDPALVQRALATLRRWKLTVDPRSLPLLLEWGRILEEQDWESALQETERGDQIRQASPMVTVLPPDVRMEILRKWRELYGQFAEESGFRAGRPKREKTSALVLAAQTASTSYTHKLPPSEVEAALMSGVVQDSPGARTSAASWKRLRRACCSTSSKSSTRRAASRWTPSGSACMPWPRRWAAAMTGRTSGTLLPLGRWRPSDSAS